MDDRPRVEFAGDAYGTTTAYGSISPLNSSLVTSHSVNLTGLSASTAYHYQVLSQDAAGTLATSSDVTFTTAAPTTAALQVNLNASEVSGVTNGSVVTPAVAPTGFTGSVVVNGAGSVNFTPVESGNGVYFLNCCSNTGNAYYKFTDATLGSIFNATQGQISFNLESRYSWSQRQATATSARYSFDVRDGNGTHQLYFSTQPNSGYLTFVTNLWGNVVYYYVPQGTENTLFGSGAILQVTVSWNAGALANCIFEQNPGQILFSYTTVTPNWTGSSNFDLGAYEYATYGGYNSSD